MHNSMTSGKIWKCTVMTVMHSYAQLDEQWHHMYCHKRTEIGFLEFTAFLDEMDQLSLPVGYQFEKKIQSIKTFVIKWKPH